MPPLSLDCPLCCAERFTSKDSLKYHLLETIDNLRCRICDSSCSDILELVDHLENNCAKEGVIKAEYTSAGEEDEDVPQMVEAQDIEMEGNDADADADPDNDPNGLYSCLMCNINFSSIENHLQKYHDGEEVLLETEDVDLDHDAENTEYDTDDTTGGDEVEESNRNIKSSQKRTKMLSVNRGSNDNDHADTDDPKDIHPPNPVIEKYLFNNGEVRLLKDDEINSIKDKSLISEILRCPTCTLKFPNASHYEKHKCISNNVAKVINYGKPKKEKPNILSHDKEGKFRCTFCQLGFFAPQDLKDHMTTHLIKDDSGNLVPGTVALSLHVCKICNTKFPTLKSLRLHGKMHKPIAEKQVQPPVDYNIMGETAPFEEGDNIERELFTCPECGKDFDMKYRDAHLKSHYEESEFNCSVCNKKFFSQANLDMHMNAHTETKKFVCSYCKRAFNTDEGLQEHKKNECQQKSYECQYCGRRFSKPHEKVKHERIHTGEKPHICQVCGKGFRVSYCLTLHMRTHTGTRPYMCAHCGKRFKSNGVYMHHLKTHSEERNYKCPFCPKAFKTSVQLSSHKNSHTKPFSCTDCNRPFASLYAVRAHMATHKKDNNLKYDCWLCGASYARCFALKDHMNAVHMEYTYTGESEETEVTTVEDGQDIIEEVVEDQQVKNLDDENESVPEETNNVEMIEA